MEHNNNILQGPIAKTSIRLGLPVAIAHLLILMYNIVDTIYISYIDRESTAIMSGIGLIFPIYFLYIALSTGLMIGISSLVARSIGEKNQNVLDRVADSGLLLIISITGFTLIIAYIFGTSLIKIMAGHNLSTESIKYGIEYFYYIAPGLGLLIVELTLLGILEGEGLTKYFGTTMLVSNLLNVILDPIFIFTFKMGVIGAALASSISISISVIYIIFIFINKKSSIKIHWNILKAKISIIFEILRIGIPHSLSIIALSISFMFLNKLIGSINESVMSAWVIFGRISDLLLLVTYGISSSTLIMIGQNFGNKNLKRVNEIYRINIIIATIGTLITALLLNIFASLIIRLFTNVQSVVDAIILQIRIISFTYIGISVSMIVSNSFQGTGKAMPGFLITVLRMGMLTIPLSYISVYIWRMGFLGIISSMAIVNIITLFSTFIIGYYYLKNLKPGNINL
jgi:putative MATE family efflux protein